MRIDSRPRLLMLVATSALVLPLAGCGDALIYAEGTNFSLTTLRLNDDPATPVRVVSGLDRTVGAVVPRRDKEGDAVNMSANFDLEHKKSGTTFPSVFGDTLKLTTEFASGAAAVAGPEQETISKDVRPLGAPAGTTSKDLRASPLAEEIIGR